MYPYRKANLAIRAISAWPRIKKEARIIFVLSFPLFCGQLSIIAANIISIMLAGRLSVHVLATVTIGLSIWSLALLIINGIMAALQTLVAQLDGAGRRAEVGALFIQALWLSVTLTLVLMAAEIFLGPILIQKIATTPELVRDTRAYLYTICISGPAFSIFCTCRGLFEGLSMTRQTFKFNLLGVVLTGPLGYALMYGAFGLPMLGAIGNGMANAIICWIQAIAFLVYMCRDSYYRKLVSQIASIVPNFRVMYDLLKFGLSIGTVRLIEGIFFVVAALVIGRAGEEALTNHQIAISIEAIACTVSFALATATTVRVAHARGCGDSAGIRQAGLIGIGMTCGTQLVCGVLILLSSSSIISLYTRNPAIIANTAMLMQFTCLLQFLDGLQTTFCGALRGLRDTRVPMVITFFAFWVVGMPVGWWLSIMCHWGMTGMWLGLIVGMIFASVLLLVRFAWIIPSGY